jgi:hypothetical protein
MGVSGISEYQRHFQARTPRRSISLDILQGAGYIDKVRGPGTTVADSPRYNVCRPGPAHKDMSSMQ